MQFVSAQNCAKQPVRKPLWASDRHSRPAMKIGQRIHLNKFLSSFSASITLSNEQTRSSCDVALSVRAPSTRLPYIREPSWNDCDSLQSLSIPCNEGDGSCGSKLDAHILQSKFCIVSSMVVICWVQERIAVSSDGVWSAIMSLWSEKNCIACKS